MAIDDNRNTSVVPDPPDAFAPRYPDEGAGFARYRKLACIGEGGMARVYKAFDPELDRDVALKVLPRGIQTTGEKRERFRREVQLLVGINIPGVIRAYDCGDHEGWQYFTMELIEGPTLKDLSHTETLSFDRKLQIIRRLARILKQLHAQDIVHRDLKPSNIMFRDNDEPVLTDFGIAKSFATETRLDLTAEDTRQGTPFYMSPDKPSVLKDLAVAKKADVYSLAVVAYELLNNRLPYNVENLTPHECLTVIREEPPSDFGEELAIPANVRAAIFQALAKDPEARPDISTFSAQIRAGAKAPINVRRVIALVLILLGLLLILAGIVAGS